jgi:hypothetical protein
VWLRVSGGTRYKKKKTPQRPGIATALAFYRRLELVKGVAACALFFRGLFQASQAALQTDAQVEATGK